MDEVGLAGPVPNPRWWWQSLTANELINVAHSSCAISGFPMKNYDGRKYSTLEATRHSSRIGILTKRVERPASPKPAQGIESEITDHHSDIRNNCAGPA
jgi:hypothetical protein